MFAKKCFILNEDFNLKAILQASGEKQNTIFETLQQNGVIFKHV